jgi:hypothetical protein
MAEPGISAAEATERSGLSEPTEREVATASTEEMERDGLRSLDHQSELLSTEKATLGLLTSKDKSMSTAEEDGITDQAEPTISVSTTTLSLSLAKTVREECTDTTIRAKAGPELTLLGQPMLLLDQVVLLTLQIPRHKSINRATEKLVDLPVRCSLNNNLLIISFSKDSSIFFI